MSREIKPLIEAGAVKIFTAQHPKAQEVIMKNHFCRIMESLKFKKGLTELDTSLDAWDPKNLVALYQTGLSFPNYRKTLLKEMHHKAKQLLVPQWEKRTAEKHSMIILTGQESAAVTKLPTNLKQAESLNSNQGEWVNVGNTYHLIPNPHLQGKIEATQIEQTFKNPPILVKTKKDGEALLHRIREDVSSFKANA